MDEDHMYTQIACRWLQSSEWSVSFLAIVDLKVFPARALSLSPTQSCSHNQGDTFSAMCVLVSYTPLAVDIVLAPSVSM